MTEHQLIADRLASLLRRRPSGLVTDIDGTISQITAPPEAAVVDPGARESLRRLLDLLDLVAVVSGRSARDAKRLVGIEGVEYIGNHGMERWVDGTAVASPAVERYGPLIAETLEDVAAAVQIPDVIFENKGLSASIHFRRAPTPDEAEAAIAAVLSPLAEQRGLTVTRGRMVIELRPPVPINKGTAVRDLIVEHGLQSVVFLGDDVTDLDAMAAVRDLREKRVVDGLLVGVVGPETPVAVAEAADFTVDGVPGVVALLAALVDRLDRKR